MTGLCNFVLKSKFDRKKKKTKKTKETFLSLLLCLFIAFHGVAFLMLTWLVYVRKFST